MVNIIHITPHMSGGLTRVLLSTLKYAKTSSTPINHEIIVFGDLTPFDRQLFKDYSDCLHINQDWNFLKSKISQADIVQIEWWNHPLINKLLLFFEFPPSRILLCSHVSGFYRPQILNKNVLEFSDIFLAATRATRNHPLFKNHSEEKLKQKLRFVTFPVDVDRLRELSFKAHNDFNVGYIGTLNYSKLHQNFLKMSASVKIPNVKFIICGDDPGGQIEAEAKQYHPEKFKFMGYQPDIHSIYETLDVFAYPLNEKHFGSGEQTIIESMYSGIPVVAFSNPAEKEIIDNNETGLLVDNEREYIEAIEYLYNNPEERLRMGRNAMAVTKKRLQPEICFQELDVIYQELLLMPKKSRKFQRCHKNMLVQNLSDPDLGAKLFIESLGSNGEEFLKSYMHRNDHYIKDHDKKIANVEPGMKMKTKGSVCQYLYFFPDDAYLNFWVGLIQQKTGDHKAAIERFEKVKEISRSVTGVDEYLQTSKKLYAV